MVKNYSLFTVALLALLAGCGNKEEVVKTASGKVVHLVNVLDEKMFADAHIKGSINVQLNDVAPAAKKWNKDDTIVIYCSNYMCTASGMAAQKLIDLGYTDVHVYEGGTAEWYQINKDDASYELVGPKKEAYLNIVLQRPTVRSSNISEISAQELKKLLKEATILS